MRGKVLWNSGTSNASGQKYYDRKESIYFHAYLLLSTKISEYFCCWDQSTGALRWLKHQEYSWFYHCIYLEAFIDQKPCCPSVTKLCPTLCNPTNCSIPGFPVLHYLAVYSNSCQLSQWCHSTGSFSVTPFSSCPQSFPASESFPVSRLIASGGQSIGVLASILPMNIQGWFPFRLTVLLSLLSKGLSRLFSSSTVQKHQFFSTQSSLCPTLTSIHDYLIKTTALSIWTFVGKVLSLLSKMLSRFVIDIFPRSKCLLILWLQSLSIVILEPKKIKSVTVPTFPPNCLPWSNGTGCHDLIFLNIVF